jgi:hypothetical protein
LTWLRVIWACSRWQAWSLVSLVNMAVGCVCDRGVVAFAHPVARTTAVMAARRLFID